MPFYLLLYIPNQLMLHYSYTLAICMILCTWMIAIASDCMCRLVCGWHVVKCIHCVIANTYETEKRTLNFLPWVPFYKPIDVLASYKTCTSTYSYSYWLWSWSYIHIHTYYVRISITVCGILQLFSHAWLVFMNSCISLQLR